MRRSILSAALFLCLLTAARPAQHRLRVFPNASLTILSIAEGPNGLIWLATTDGLYRFDGFHYHKITSFPFTSARYVGFTRDGALWGGDFEGLARVHDNRFQVLMRDQVDGLAVYPDQVFVRLKHLVQIGLDGSPHHLKQMPRRDLTVDPSGRLWFVCMTLKQGCWVDPRKPDEVHLVELGGGYEFQQAAPDPKGGTWAADGEHAVLIENGLAVTERHRKRTQQTSRPSPLMFGQKGQLWFLGETIQGLVSKIDFHDRADHDRFAPTAGLEDRGGHLWTASLGQGLVEWIPEPEWSRWYPEDFAGEAAVQVVRNKQGSVILATQKNLYRQNASDDTWQPLSRTEYRYDSLLPLPDGGFLASIRQLGLVRLSADGHIVERIPDPSPEVEQYREIARDGKGRLWVGTKRALLRIEGKPGSLHLRQEKLPMVQVNAKEDAVDLEVDQAGRLWVGFEEGVAWLDDQDRWHKLATDQPIMLVRSIALAGDDIWVAHRRSGAFSRLHRNGDLWNVSVFYANAGYGPADTEFIKRDSRGWIWRGSSDGVYVADGLHFSPTDWIHIQQGNGLASREHNQYGFFEDRDGSVWIAGEDGVSHIRPQASWFEAPRQAPPPQVTRVEADGRVFLFPAPLPTALPSDTKILRIDVGSLHASPFRDYPLRYRLLPLVNDWKISRGGSLEFSNLPQNAYTLEMGFSGAGPSAVGTYPFRIGSGGTASWPWLVGLLMVTSALVPMFRRAPWLDRARFRVEKSVFLLRRRFSHQSSGSPGGVRMGQDYSGETLGGYYQLSRMVSRGGFSVVYEARDLRGGIERLAVKVLNRASGQDSWVRDRFAHEVSALRSVDHPGVVRVLDSWVSADGEPCLAMPFLDGQTVRAALSQQRFTPVRTARIVRQMGDALAEVHGRGIIHRDLKPENLILLAPGEGEEQTVIIDFGTAGLRSAENELAATTLMAGSFHYMAPERLTGRYSPASDVFSFGVIVLEMLTGKRLADLKATFSDSTFQEELEKALCVSVDLGAVKVLADCLARAYDPEPRRRPSAVKTWAEEVAEALDRG